MNERRTRRFSQAISEGEGISVLAEVATAADAENASRAGADAVVVRDDASGVHDATDLPVLSHVGGNADACVLRFARHDAEELEQRYRTIVDGGTECVVEVTNEEELEEALDLLDPEILLLSSSDDDERFERVLDLLPDVPAGKLVVADLGATSGDQISALERVGVDAVIVRAHDVAAFVGDEPPDV